MIEILCRENGLVHRALTGPTLRVTHDRKLASRSIFSWREEGPGRYRLTPLGVLNVIGVQLRVLRLRDDPPERPVI